MLGNQLYKIEVKAELSNERLKSLVFFYGPLVGHSALALYEYLVLKGSTIGFDEINNLLYSLNISVDVFEEQCGKLNEYKLLKTLRQENKYVFIFENPMTIKKFIKDDILVRDFILKTSGVHYQELIADVYDDSTYDDYEDISRTLSLDAISKWSKEDETYLRKENTNQYSFNTLFDVNVFLKDISTNLLPMKFRTKENMLELATLADLYNISYDKMRTFIPKVVKIDSNEFDFTQLKYLCINAKSEYTKVEDGNYNVPCLAFLMNLQNGKEATEYDKKILSNLSSSYHLNTSVINVLIEHCLKTCDNRLIEKYLYAIASDFHRNNVVDAKGALSRLNKPYNKDEGSDKLPVYATDKNNTLSQDEADELLRLMGKK